MMHVDGCTEHLAGLKKTKVGTVIPNSDQNVPNGRYSKNKKNVSKYYCLQGVPEGESFKKYKFYDKNYGFPTPIFKRQLLDCRAISCWKELFELKKMTYYLSIYVHIW